MSSPPAGETEMAALVRLYVSCGRYSDAVTLLENAPNWGVGDLADLDDDSTTSAPMTVVAARALAKTGRQEDAARLARYTIRTKPLTDEAYAILLDTDPAAGAFLDAMHAAAPALPRPQIWKAEWLRRHGRLAEAETIAQHAIEVDPQDLSEGWSGRRYQPYSILAGIEKEEGKLEAAKTHQAIFEGYIEPRNYDDPKQDTLEFKSLDDKIQTLANNPNDLNLRRVICSDLNQLGRREEAKRQTVAMVRCLAENLGPVSDTVLLEIDEEYAPDCVAAVEEFIRKDPKRAANYAAMGLIYYGSDQIDKAVGYFAKSLTLDPNFGPSLSAVRQLSFEFSIPQALTDHVILHGLTRNPFAEDNLGLPVSDLQALWEALQSRQTLTGGPVRPAFTLNASAKRLSSNEIANIEANASRHEPPNPMTTFTKEQTVTDFLDLIRSVRSSSGGTR